jgi:hypothetical protein
MKKNCGGEFESPQMIREKELWGRNTWKGHGRTTISRDVVVASNPMDRPGSTAVHQRPHERHTAPHLCVHHARRLHVLHLKADMQDGVIVEGVPPCDMV